MTVQQLICFTLTQGITLHLKLLSLYLPQKFKFYLSSINLLAF